MEPGQNRNLSLVENFYTESRIVCKEHYGTTFDEEKVHNAEKESKEKTDGKYSGLNLILLFTVNLPFHCLLFVSSETHC
jgi:hypothetical protein